MQYKSKIRQLRRKGKSQRRQLRVESLERRDLLSAVTPGDQVRVNSFLDFGQQDADMAMDSQGNYVVVWGSDFQDASTSGIYGQRFTAIGAAIGNEFKISGNFAIAGSPRVSVAPSGESVVVFVTDGSVYGQRYDATGDADGPLFKMDVDPASGSDWVRDADVAMDVNGNFAVGYINEDFSQAGEFQVHVQRYDAIGNVSGPDQSVPAVGYSEKVSMSMYPDGGAFVAYTTTAITTTGEAVSQVLAHQIDETWGPAGNVIEVSSDTTGYKYSVDTAIDAAGNAVTVWSSSQQDGDGSGVYGQRLNASATKLGSEFPVNTTTAGHQQQPSVAVDDHGNFLVAWSGGVATNDIFAQRYNASGTMDGSEFPVTDNLIGTNSSPSVGMDASGDFAIAWDTVLSGEVHADVYARVFEENDEPVADAGGPYIALEGQTITLSAIQSFDADGDSLLYRWDFDNDGTWDTSYSDSTEITHAWSDDFNGTAKLEVSDGQSTVTANEVVTISNVTPVVKASSSVVAFEGIAVTFDASIVDPGLSDTHVLEWDFGDGSPTSTLPTHVFDASGDYTVMLTVTDDDGGVATDFLNLSVANLAPTIESISQSGPVDPGVAVTVTVVASDVVGDELTYRFDFDGDGFYDAENDFGVASVTFDEANVYAIGVHVSDQEGAVSNGIVVVEVGASPTVIPTVEFVSSGQSISEDVVVAEFSVVLDQAVPSHDVIVPIVLSGTASGEDYQLDNLFVTIPSGSTSATFRMDIVDDGVHEGVETIVVELGDAFYAQLGPSTTHTLTIDDNDVQPAVRFGSLGQTAHEGDTASVDVSLTAPSSLDVSIPLLITGTAEDGSDFLIAERTIVVPGNQGLTRGSARIAVADDAFAESAEMIQFNLGTLTNAVASSQQGDPLFHVITIPQNDIPSVSFTQSFVRASEDAGVVSAVVQVSSPTAIPITVPFRIGGDAGGDDRTIRVGSTEFAGATGVLTIPASPSQAPSGSIAIEILNDALDESSIDDVRLELVESADTGDLTGAVLGGTSNYRLDINDDDTPRIAFALTNATSVWEDGGNIEFTVTSSLPSDEAITVPISLSANNITDVYGYASSETDFTVSTESIVIPAFATEVTRVINIVDDTNNEPYEKVVLSLGEPSRGKLGLKATHEISVLDNDPSISIMANTNSTLESDTSIYFTVSIDDVTNEPVVVEILRTGTANEQDASFAEGENLETQEILNIFNLFGNNWFSFPDISFNPPVYRTTQAVTIPPGSKAVTIRLLVKDDLKEEPDETVALQLGEVIDGGAKANGSQSAASTTIENDDSPTVSIRARKSGQSLLQIGESLFANPFAKDNVSVRLNVQAINDVWVKPRFVGYSVPAQQDVDYRVSGLNKNGYLKIPAGETSASLRVSAIDDDIYKGTRKFRIEIDEVVNASLTKLNSRKRLNVTILDDEKPPVDDPKPPPSNSCVVSSQGNAVTTSLAISTLIPGCVPTGDLSGTKLIVPSGSPSVSNDSTPLSPAGTFAFGSNGLLDGTTAFFDGNANGISDFLDLNDNRRQDEGEPSEPSTTTYADGSFLLVIPDEFDRDADGFIGPGEGRWVLSGGVDTSTELPWSTRMYALPGQYVITPLTTLTTSLVQSEGFALEAAQQRVIDAFELPPAELSRLNPLANMAHGDEIAARYWVTHVELYSTVVQIAELFSGATDSLPVEYFGDFVYADLASKIHDPESGFDLSDQQLIADVLTGVSFATGIEFSQDIISGAAAVIAAGNQAIDALPPAGDEAYATSVAKIKKVAQGDAAGSLHDVGAGTQTIAAVIADFTGGNLQARIDAATVGTVIPSFIEISDAFVREGDDGTSILEFSVRLTGDHDSPVSVNYATLDNTAINGTDYTVVTGTLTWAAHDVDPKTVQVTVQGDTDFESDEIVELHLAGAQNAVLRRSIGVGYLLNDDEGIVTATVPASGTSNTIEIAHSSLFESVFENGLIVSDGTYFEPQQRAIIGRDDIDDQLILDFTNDSYRMDTLRFDGGDGAGTDSTEILGGTFASIVHFLGNESEGQTILQPSGEEEAITYDWLGVESSFVLNAGNVEQMILQLPDGGSSAILEDADPTDSDPLLAGKMQLRSTTVPPAFTTTMFNAPTGVLVVLAGDQDDRIVTGDLDPTFTSTILVDRDYGDAPASYGTETTWHLSGGPRLGTRDYELFPLSPQDGTGDDATDTGSIDDEDGIGSIATIVSISSDSTTSSVSALVTGSGKLDAWIDFNQDGDWLDTGEQIVDSLEVNDGINTLSFSVLGGAIAGETAARFRLSTVGNLGPTGAANDGEVEDYMISIVDGEAVPDVDVVNPEGVTFLSRENDQIVVGGSVVNLFRAPIDKLGGMTITGVNLDNSITVDQSGGDVVPSGGLIIDGLGGVNELRVVGTGAGLDLSSSGNLSVRNVSRIDLTEPGANEIILDAAAVESMSPNQTLRVLGGEDDEIDLVDQADWRMGTTSIIDGRLVRQLENLTGPQTIDSEFPHAWKNLVNAYDTDNNGRVSPADILTVINELADRFYQGDSGDLPDPLQVTQWPGRYYDPNGSDTITPADILFVINYLADRAQSGHSAGAELVEAEAIDMVAGHWKDDDPFDFDEDAAVRASESLSSIVRKVSAFDTQAAPGIENMGTDQIIQESADATQAIDELLTKWQLDELTLDKLT